MTLNYANSFQFVPGGTISPEIGVICQDGTQVIQQTEGIFCGGGILGQQHNLNSPTNINLFVGKGTADLLATSNLTYGASVPDETTMRVTSTDADIWQLTYTFDPVPVGVDEPNGLFVIFGAVFLWSVAAKSRYFTV